MSRTVPFIVSTTLILILVGQPVGSQTPVRIGDEGQVNTYTTGDQRSPAVGVDDEGNVVVVWESAGSESGDTYSIQGRIFFPNGFPAGPEDQVNTFTTGSQAYPSVAVDTDGDFVVVWQSHDPTDADYSIQGQRYGSNGLPAGGEFQVNSYTPDDQKQPAVGMNANGDFVVVWESDGSDGDDSDGNSIQGQRYRSDGARAGTEFQVNSFTTDHQGSPAVGMNANGDFVVVWKSQGSHGGDTDSSIQGRIFASSGVPITPQVQVNNYSTGGQSGPAVGVDDEGNFVVVWSSIGSAGTDTDSFSIQGRIYASNGVPIGLQAQVNTYTTSTQISPAVGVDADSNFVVVWRSFDWGGDVSPFSIIQGQRYSADGNRAGEEFRVNTYTTGDLRTPEIGFDAEGNFVVVWGSDHSSGNDDSGTSIQGQRFEIPLFADGFEFGDTSRWSSSVP